MLIDESHEWQRMLSVGEYRDVMGFPKDYKLPDKVTEAIGMLGNAVVPDAAAYVLGCVARAMNSDKRRAA